MKNFECGIKLFLTVLICIALGLGSGCGRNSKTKEALAGQTIAKINNYDLTVGDFRDEAHIIAPNMSLPADPEMAKETVLNELITKKVLLQAAQTQNFDKDEKFMKEIERYWEQALLKLLMKKKIDEFSKKIPADIQGDLRQQKLRSELTKWIADLRSSAKVKINKENLKKAEIK